MNDTITIADLAVSYHVGVPDEERAQPQRLLLTIEMTRDFSSATVSDDLRLTIDYYAVSQRLLDDLPLIETLAVEIAEMIRADFKPASVSVEVKKFIIAEARHVAVKVIRPAK